MVSGARYVFLGLVWLYVAAFLYQVYLAGSALFSSGGFQPHRDLGWILHLVPVLLLIAAAIARVGSRLIWWTAALLVVQFIQPILPGLRADLPWVAALHPVLALLIFWLSAVIGLQAWRLVREPAVEFGR
jgi:hypothetical protein